MAARRGRRLAVAVAACGFGLGAARADAWGFEAHRLVHEWAVRTLPPRLAPLFTGNVDYLSEHSVDPDLWRAGEPGEAPNHYLDLDAFDAFPFDRISRVEAEHLARHGAGAVEDGRAPWRVAEEYAALVAAFRSGVPEQVLLHAAVLGHYVADAHVPLHAAHNHDGQFSGQTGIHTRWETGLVHRFAEQIAAHVSVHAAQPLTADPVEATFRILRDSFRESAGVLASDRAAAGRVDFLDTPEDDRYDDAYYSRLYAREADRLHRRLSEAADDVGSFWLTAWVAAGRPSLPGGFRPPHLRGRSRAALVSLDGASATVIEDAIARGVLPRLAALRAQGARGRLLSSLPAKTATGHAALFTGTWSPRNGIGGNWAPVEGASLLDWTNGYSSTLLRAEPLWVTAARQGLRATVLSATQDYPFDPFENELRFGGRFGRSLTLVDGYQNLEAPAAADSEAEWTLVPPSGWPRDAPGGSEARELSIQVVGHRIDGLAFDDPDDPTVGLDTLLLTLDKDPGQGVRLKPEPLRDDAAAFRALRLPGSSGTLSVHFRLFELAPDGSRLLLFQAAPHRAVASRAEFEKGIEKVGGFVGNAWGWSYTSGRLGPPLWRGGDGTAERRYLESVALVEQQFERLNALAIERTRWDLLVTYLPFPDEFLHVWLGFVDERLPGHDPRLAARVRPFLDRGLGLVDRYVGALRDALADDVVLVVAGDHGQIATEREFRPNVVLAQAGLVGVGSDGVVDLSTTRAAYFRGNSGFVLVNRARLPGGIVAPEHEDEVLQAAATALEAARDPETGAAIVRAVLRPGRGALPDFGGPSGGDLYLSLAPGYTVSPAATGPLAEARLPAGEHLLDPELPEMHVALTVVGPGIAAGGDLGDARVIDVAPTLCALMGLAPPAQATGRVLGSLVAPPGEEATAGRAPK